MDQINVVQNSAASRFEAAAGEYTATLDYQLGDGHISLIETQVPKPMEGKGIGSALAKAGLEYARINGLSVRVECPFVQSYLERHPEYRDLLN